MKNLNKDLNKNNLKTWINFNAKNLLIKIYSDNKNTPTIFKEKRKWKKKSQIICLVIQRSQWIKRNLPENPNNKLKLFTCFPFKSTIRNIFFRLLLLFLITKRYCSLSKHNLNIINKIKPKEIYYRAGKSVQIQCFRYTKTVIIKINCLWKHQIGVIFGKLFVLTSNIFYIIIKIHKFSIFLGKTFFYILLLLVYIHKNILYCF